MKPSRVTVLGGGSWGTALAVLLARGGHDVRLWMRTAAEAVERDRRNARFLPGVELPDGLSVTSDMPAALAGTDVIVGAVPSRVTREVAALAAPHVPWSATWVSATKGLEPGSRLRMTQVLQQALPDLRAPCVLSGPSFAGEVAEGQPTAVVIACADLATARSVQELLSGPTFRAYTSRDVVGVELGGSVKNVIAIAAGLLSGLGLGHDPLAALVTRGLHEMTSLAVALGAEPRTLGGLAGLGDLVLTCTGGASRNRRLGELVARGTPLQAALAQLGQVAEGVDTTHAVLDLAADEGVDVPITASVRDVLFAGMPPAEAIAALMQRSLKDELS